jgi:hypothetical protein
VVEAKDELLQVTLQVFRADAVEGSAEPGLQIPEESVRPGQQMDGRVSATALARAMLDAEPTQRRIRTPGIGEDLVGVDRARQRLSRLRSEA